MSETPETFTSRSAAWQYLRDSGEWQISQTQFYQHCAQGRLRRQRDGTYLRADVDKYAKLHCRQIATGQRARPSLDRIQEEKAEVDLSHAKVKLEREELKLAADRGDYVPRDDVERMIVSRAIALTSHLQAMTRMRAADWIELVDGKPDRAPELIAAVEGGLEEFLSQFARDVEFEVLLEKNVREPAPEQDAEETEESE